MPVFDQGYQHWEGALSSHYWRWWTITRHGVRALSRSWWTRLAVLAAWMPAIGLVAVLIVWELFEQKSSLITPLLSLMRQLPPEIQQGPRQFRVAVWTMAFDTFFRIEMLFWMILVMIVGPGLVSQDLRFNAFGLYFSRPLGRLDYFAGKLGVIAAFLALATTGPAVVAYVLGTAFSRDLSILTDTAHLFGAILAYGLIVTLSSGMLMLAISSLSRSSLYVGLVWAALWLVSSTVGGVLLALVRKAWCPLVAYVGNLERVGSALLGRDKAIEQFLSIGRAARQAAGRHSGPSITLPEPAWYWSALVLAVLFGISVWILTMRVRSLDRLK